MQYDASKKAWMTANLFETWIRSLDRQFCRQKRQVILFLDNCTAHPPIDGLTNIRLAFLPPNTTAKLQPLDQGIIRSLKALYRKKLLAKLISSLDKGEEFSVNVLDALHFLRAAWDDVTSTTVTNCFRKAGFMCSQESTDADDGDTSAVVSEVQQQFQCLLQSGIGGLQNVSPEEYITADEEVETVGELTNADIVAQVQSQQNAEDEDEDDDDSVQNDEPMVTVLEAQQCIKKLRCFFEAEEDASKFFSSINDMDCYLDRKRATFRQTKITDFLV